MSDNESGGQEPDGVECDYCDRTFDTKQGYYSHKGHAHPEKARVEVECEWCGDTHERPKCHVEEKNFCDDDCYKSWHSENRVGENASNWKGGKRVVECEWCGDDFEVYPNRHDDVRFCGSKCSTKARSEYFSGENGPGWKGGKGEFECDYCGTSFRRHKSNVDGYDQTFCGLECYGKWRSENVCGEDHPQYINGTNGFAYGPGWNEAKRRAVRKRDGFQCQSCDVGQEEHKEVYDRRLAVHHIIPARKFDDPQERNRMDNLISFCMRCHNRWEGIPLRPQ